MFLQIFATITFVIFSSLSFAGDSACLMTVRNSVWGLEKSAHIPSFELVTINQSVKGLDEEITLMSNRSKGLGNKMFVVEVTNRELGDNKETICEIKSLRSFIEQN